MHIAYLQLKPLRLDTIRGYTKVFRLFSLLILMQSFKILNFLTTDIGIDFGDI
jgi:hypothetical protein